MARRVIACRSGLGPDMVYKANHYLAWAPYGNNTASQDGDAVKISYVDNAGGGYVYMVAGTGLNANTLFGHRYLLTCQTKVSPGASVLITTWNTNIVSRRITSAEYVDFLARVVVTNSIWALMVSSMGPGQSIWVRNISLREYK